MYADIKFKFLECPASCAIIDLAMRCRIFDTETRVQFQDNARGVCDRQSRPGTGSMCTSTANHTSDGPEV
jgi:hypothetical protein